MFQVTYSASDSTYLNVVGSVLDMDLPLLSGAPMSTGWPLFRAEEPYCTLPDRDIPPFHSNPPKDLAYIQTHHQYRTQLLDKVTAIDISVDKYSISLSNGKNVMYYEGTYQYRLPESVQCQLLGALADLLIVRLCDQRSFKVKHMWGLVMIRIVT